jgi:hypothetical protein
MTLAAVLLLAQLVPRMPVVPVRPRPPVCFFVPFVPGPGGVLICTRTTTVPPRPPSPLPVAR